ncbi:MAG: response regulator [Bdellovibrionales bacterium]
MISIYRETAFYSKYLNPRTWWRRTPVTKKPYIVVGVMAVLIAVELLTLLFAMNTLSAVRALVGGESSWSKAQKNAVMEIQAYAYTQNPHHYVAFMQHIKTPMGDHKARLEMQKSNMNMQAVRDGFVQGQIHPEDIDPIVTLLQRFYWVDYIKNALDIWAEGDEMMYLLIGTAQELHEEVLINPKNADPQKIRVLLTQISHINVRLTEVEHQFSYILGEASRSLENLLMLLLLIAVVTVEITGFILTSAYSRGLGRALSELRDFANAVGAGNLTKYMPVRSRDEIGQLAAALNKMAENLNESTSERQVAKDASNIKSLFLANMSHEIRTPLNSILGFVDLLKDQALHHEERLMYLNIIERTGYTLSTIINDILDVSKVEAGKLEISKTPCSTHELLSDLKFLLNLRCEEKGIYLDFRIHEIPSRIITDPTRVKQVLLNVIGNAIKFTEKGGVTVSVQQTATHLEWSIEDTGIGLTADGIAKLFQPFSQIDLSIRKKFGGTGLGLILSKRLAQLLGGDVTLLQSAPGQGSTFVVTIQLESAGEIHVAPKVTVSTPTTNPLAGIKILVVEDSVDNQLLAGQYLTKAGAQVDIASHGQEAIEITSHNHYDLVLMDMQMPVMDGYTATAELRKRGYHMPVIALTAHAMKEDLEKCLRVGCNSYLSKPYRRDGLIDLIHHHCSHAQAA